MPNYTDQIPIEEISQSMSQTNTTVTRINMALDAMSSKLQMMNDLISKRREFARDELQQMSQFKVLVSGTAEEAKKLYGEGVKGMTDFSIAIKAAEDRFRSYTETEKRLRDETTKLSEKRSKIEESLEGRLTKQKKKNLTELTGSQETTGKKVKRAAEDELKTIDLKITKNRELLSDNRKQSENARKTLEESEKLYQSGRKRLEMEDEIGGRRRRRGVGGIGALEVASDLRLPGISTAAQIARYGQAGARALAPAAEEGMGVGGLARGALGGLGGIAGGAAVAFGGYTALQGYKAYQTAHQLGGGERTLLGMMGPGRGMKEGRVAYGQDLTQYGYSTQENLQDLIQMSRQMGGRGARRQLGGASAMALRFGMERGEIGAGAGALQLAGGARPETSVRMLEKVMSEGVRSGMDRARITHFTDQVVNIQEELLKSTGESNAEAIASSLGDLLKASGRGEAFFRGPEMQAIRGIDAAMKQVGRGAGGPGAATMMRAFGFGAGGMEGGPGAKPGLSTGQKYYQAMRYMEGGLFGGGGKEEGGAIGRIRRVVGQYTKETGGNEQAANIRMMREMGVGLRQTEALRNLLQKMGTRDKMTEKEGKELQKIMQEAKDPMIQLIEIQKKQDSNIASLARDTSPGILDIDKGILAANKESVDILKSIAKALGATAEAPSAPVRNLPGVPLTKPQLEQRVVHGAGATGMAGGQGERAFAGGTEMGKALFNFLGLTPKATTADQPAAAPGAKTQTATPDMTKASTAEMKNLTQALNSNTKAIENSSFNKRIGDVGGVVR